jgi:hypothetical protein
MQSPQAWHLSLKSPCSTGIPIKTVSKAGTVGTAAYLSFMAWTPTPQAVESTISDIAISWAI